MKDRFDWQHGSLLMLKDWKHLILVSPECKAKLMPDSLRGIQFRNPFKTG